MDGVTSASAPTKVMAAAVDRKIVDVMLLSP
jgi:hypothetical protein